MKVLLIANECNSEWAPVPQFVKKISAASQKKIAASFHERISAETIAASLKAAGDQ